MCKPTSQRVLVEYLTVRVTLQAAPILQQRTARVSVSDSARTVDCYHKGPPVPSCSRSTWNLNNQQRLRSGYRYAGISQRNAQIDEYIRRDSKGFRFHCFQPV